MLLDVAVDWSDHALWWPKKNMWLSRTRTTLDQYGVQADAELHFTPMHKTLRIQLPDLRFIDTRVDFSIKCFAAVVQLCKDLNVRYPEELSFCRPLSHDHLKQNYKHIGVSPRQRSRNVMGPLVQNNSKPANISTPDKKSVLGLDKDVSNHNATWNGTKNHITSFYNGHTTPDNSFSFTTDPTLPNLAVSPSAPTLEAKNALIRPKSLVEKARLNSGWLDSSLSLFEQDVREFDLLLLRFKFFYFYDLNSQLDATRINQIYEQARWSILTEEIDCTEEEMMMFAALQLQVILSSNNPLPEKSRKPHDDDIETKLNELEMQLENSSLASLGVANITHIPELADDLKFMKPKKFTLKGFKRLYFVFKDRRLSAFKSREDRVSEPLFVVNLRGCEVTPDVNISQAKYGIKLGVPNPEGMSEYWFKCESEGQYARWMAAFRLASKGRTMADSSYENEVHQILDFLNMQHPAAAPVISPSQIDINPEDYVAARFLRKLKGRSQVMIFFVYNANLLYRKKLH